MNAAAARGGGTTSRPAAAAWRVVEPETGDPAFICPGCWPAVAAYWRARADAIVRELGARPPWARCGVCEPECVC